MPDVAIVSPESDKVFSRMLALELEAKKGIASVCTDYGNVPYKNLKLIVISSSDISLMAQVRDKAVGKHITCITFGRGTEKNEAPDFVRPFPIGVFVETVYGILYPEGNNLPELDKKLNFSLDSASNIAIYGNKSVELSAREFQLISYLYENRNRAVSRAELREKVWKTDTSSNNTDVYINYLRRKLDEKLNKKFIFTERGEGYRLKI